jgi:hypothetical protein
MSENSILLSSKPRRSPLAPLKKGGTGLKSPCLVRYTVGEPEQYAHPLLGATHAEGTSAWLHPLFKGDLAAFLCLGFPPNKKTTRQGDLPTGNVASRLLRHPLKYPRLVREVRGIFSTKSTGYIIIGTSIDWK